MWLTDRHIRLKCLELVLDHYPDIRPDKFQKCLDYMYQYVTQKEKKEIKSMDSKIDYKDMFKSWAYWKPTVIILSVIASIIGSIFITPWIIVGLLLLAVVALFVFMLHSLGLHCYETYMDNIKKNYKKLTDKDWDAD